MKTVGEIIQRSNGSKKLQALWQDSPQRMMLVNKYGDREAFLLTFNPDYQKIICGNTDECFFGDYPTLAILKEGYGRNAASLWLLPQLNNLSEYCGCKEKLEGKAIEECAFIIATDFFYLKISELMLFFHRFKTGRYGRFYGSVDPLIITTALREFITERSSEIDRMEQIKREKKNAEHRKGAISYEEWKRRKSLTL